MVAKSKYFRHIFAGGAASDFGNDAETAQIDEGTIGIPFLLEAENLVYELDGAPVQAPGTEILESNLKRITLPGASGDFVSSPDLAISTSAIDLKVHCMATDWTPTTNTVLI